jgi:hypothetical protein
LGLGSAALGSLMIPDLFGGNNADEDGLTPGIPHFAPKAKRVIYLFQNGAPSQQELYSITSPNCVKCWGRKFRPSVRGTQRLTGMTANQKQSFPLVGFFCEF